MLWTLTRSLSTYVKAMARVRAMTRGRTGHLQLTCPGLSSTNLFPTWHIMWVEFASQRMDILSDWAASLLQYPFKLDNFQKEAIYHLGGSNIGPLSSSVRFPDADVYAFFVIRDGRLGLRRRPHFGRKDGRCRIRHRPCR